jgi:rhodanese-related sulfurtransferase
MLLSRIDKEHFIKLIKTPALKYIEYAELADEQNKGVVVLDIRDASDYNKGHIAGSQNMPFFSLRLHGKELKAQDKKVVVVCKDGALSEAAAFVLLKNRVEVKILIKGMQDLVDVSEVVDTQELAAVKEESAEELLQKENVSLKAEIVQLNDALINLAKQNRMLIKQTDKLKSVLDRKM